MGAIVWATGFRPDYGWIELPVLDASGRPLHRRGLTDFPGLAFVGMHWLHKRTSSLFIGVARTPSMSSPSSASRRRVR